MSEGFVNQHIYACVYVCTTEESGLCLQWLSTSFIHSFIHLFEAGALTSLEHDDCLD